MTRFVIALWLFVSVPLTALAYGIDTIESSIPQPREKHPEHGYWTKWFEDKDIIAWYQDAESEHFERCEIFLDKVTMGITIQVLPTAGPLRAEFSALVEYLIQVPQPDFWETGRIFITQLAGDFSIKPNDIFRHCNIPPYLLNVLKTTL